MALSSAIENPGPRFPPTKGEVWPKPQEETKGNIVYKLNPSSFEIKVTSQTCDILERAVARYKKVITHMLGVSKRARRNLHHHNNTNDDHHQHSNGRGDHHQHSIGCDDKGSLTELTIELSAVCEDYPHFDMDEKYSLNVSTSAKLRSASIWGVLRGLETFVQLLYLTDDYTGILVKATSITDYPRYPHRGLLLDTSRHYIHVNNILKTLVAMEMNKMNVFHWHIVDDQSFPYESERFPELSEMGAFHSSMIYTKSDISLIVEYAKNRGIRVVPEFDVPGHTRSWGVAFPDILTKCYNGDQVIGLGPMNPINNMTYKLLRDLYKEAQEWFPDKYFHIGGDEVEMSCWNSNPELSEYMKQNNLTVSQLHALFMNKVVPMLQGKSKTIVWEEVFTEGVPLPKDALVQAWKVEGGSKLREITTAGYQALYSASWYLDHLGSNGDWEKYYKIDPRELLGNKTLAPGVVGGEACMWGEVVDDQNVLSRVWPRASAVAERLWTNDNHLDWNMAKRRLEEHTCRMIRRDVPAQPPTGPGFCFAG